MPTESKSGKHDFHRAIVTIVTGAEDEQLAVTLRTRLLAEGFRRTQILENTFAPEDIQRGNGNVVVIFVPRSTGQQDAFLASSQAITERQELQPIYVCPSIMAGLFPSIGYSGSPIVEYTSETPNKETYERIVREVLGVLSNQEADNTAWASEDLEDAKPGLLKLGDTVAAELSLDDKLAFAWASEASKTSEKLDSFMLFKGLLATASRKESFQSLMIEALAAQRKGMAATWTALAKHFAQPEIHPRFLKGSDGHPDKHSIDSFPVVRPRREVVQVIRLARDFAMRTHNSLLPYTRHLFAAMLAPSTAFSVQRELKHFGFDVATLRRALLDLVLSPQYSDGHENRGAWRELFEKETSASQASEFDKQSGPKPSLNYLARYSPDFVDFRAEPDAGDPLKIQAVASQLAALLAYRETPLPLAVGLFGDWGSGKTTFMQRLRHEIDNLARPEKSGRFCKKVVHIYFNAWHYMDASLWASLVTEIFDGILREVTRGKTDEDKVKAREALVHDLAQARGLVREAHNELEVAKKQRAAAETDHIEAVRVREQREQTVRGLLDDLATVARAEPGVMASIQEAAEALGWPEGIKSYQELEERVKEMRQLSNRATKLFVTVFGEKNRWRRIALLVCALTAPLIVGVIVKLLLVRYHVETQQVWSAIMQFGVFVTAFSGWLSTQIKRGDSLLKRLDDGYADVTRLRAQKKEGPAERAARTQLAAAEAEEEAKRKRVEQVNEKVQALEAELKELEPGRRLFRFIEERASAADYRKHLGLVSLIRRDFEQLGQLLSQSNALKDSEERPIERIVLYVDDLDRCQTSRVVEVLEAVHMLLAFPLFVVVVAVDPRWLRSSLEAQYPHLLGLNADRDEEKRELLRNSTTQDYLEKIFQVPLNLSRIEPDDFGVFVANLAGPSRRDESAESGNPEVDDQTEGGAAGFTPPEARNPTWRQTKLCSLSTVMSQNRHRSSPIRSNSHYSIGKSNR